MSLRILRKHENFWISSRAPQFWEKCVFLGGKGAVDWAIELIHHHGLTCSGNICNYSAGMPLHLMYVVYNRWLDTLWAFYVQHIKISTVQWQSFVCMYSEHNVPANVRLVHLTPCKIAYSNCNGIGFMIICDTKIDTVTWTNERTNERSIKCYAIPQMLIFPNAFILWFWHR